MTPLILLDQIKLFADDTLKDLLLPVSPQKDNPTPVPKPPDVFKMNLPIPSANEKAALTKAPYLLLQFLTGKDDQQPGDRGESTGVVRMVGCCYCEDAQEGALHVLNLFTRLRTSLLKERVIGKQFTLQLPLEYLVYPDSPAPYYMGEMMTTWEFRTIQREIKTNF